MAGAGAGAKMGNLGAGIGGAELARYRSALAVSTSASVASRRRRCGRGAKQDATECRQDRDFTKFSWLPAQK